MEYYDEELLEARREQERKKHNTLETGIYAGDELIQFTDVILPDSRIHIPLPELFVVMPEVVKQIKYPSRYAPEYIQTSLDSMVNFAFNQLDVKAGDVKAMSSQFQEALKNVNPATSIKNSTDTETAQGNEMSWFEYTGFQLDGQSYNRVCLIKMKKSILHGIFSCQLRDKGKWELIAERIFYAVEEDT